MYRPIAITVVLLGLAAGCGGKADQGIEITGNVALDGKPLEMGMVYLHPETGGPAENAPIVKDGTFKCYSIKPGRYKAAVQTSMYAAMADAQAKNTGGGKAITMRPLDGTYRAVPPKYEKPETSSLAVEVKAGEPVKLELNSK